MHSMSAQFNVRVWVTAQHREMLDQVLSASSVWLLIYDLSVVQSRIWVIMQGDTHYNGRIGRLLCQSPSGPH
jgi:UDP-N-acetylglucosamine 2-epimerase